ncbi:alpha/beta-hydrolase [Daldinia caldariorum]|uniref:alpha/beta-hydrolase n=1 Tax=Daldinia caldariorum TaxID=326644 RepID=UPI002008A428|nr:alpha/beta-hydrolase [Daldinia caldariorum]KAI1472253.1 alpha/beta-hydrolase [Daldinia caldariorum]
MNAYHIPSFFLSCILYFFSPALASSALDEDKARTRSSFPILNLPYASYRAARYDSMNDIYTFKNIRYAAPPVGALRWAKPAPPLNQSGIQDGGIGHSCIQAAPNGLNLLGTGNQSPMGGAINQLLGGIPLPIFSGGNVPGKALETSSEKLPVVVFVCGGAYVFGSKDSLQPELPFYDGTGLISQSGNNMIFVAMNYRVGAFGFLAGTTMENEGVPNAGLWDQRAAFRWVKDYISLVGGDPRRVTAIGQSAGGGSIMHHIVGQGGKLDPLFSKAILLSPAFEYMWDRAGTAQKKFEAFARLAGCASQGVSCLLRADASTLANANTQLMKQQYSGTFAVGPTPDGSYIRQLPVLELSTGNFWDIESLVLSHTIAESNVFVNGVVRTDKDFASFVDTIFPNYTQAARIADKVSAFYTVSRQSKYKSETDRMQAVVRDSSFTCNIRHLTESFGSLKVWNIQYGVSPGWHGTDLFPIFSSKLRGRSWLENLAALMTPGIGWLVPGISVALQSYLTSYIVTGDPNTGRKIFNLPPTIKWDHPSSQGEQISGVVNVGN